MSMSNQDTSYLPHEALPLKQLFGLSAGAGLSVASIYYSQPIIGLLAQSFHLGVSEVGLVPTLTQVGYALGILLLVPFGDSVDRKKLILLKSFLLCGALLLCSIVPTFSLLLLVSLLIGVLATTAQDIVPAAAAMADPEQSGKTVGTVMTGLLSGILLSRVFSGSIGEYLGWQIVFQIAALAVAAISLCLWRLIPAMPSSNNLSYRDIMSSLLPLWRQYPQLKQAAFAQSLMSLSFSAFWTTLAVFLFEYYGLGSAAAGAFGLAGAAGAVAAPLAGIMADRLGANKVTLLSISIVIVSFVVISLALLLPEYAQIPALVIGVITFDFGLNATLIAHQSIVYGLKPEARGRLNSILFTFVFIGMALGSALGSYLYGQFGWYSVLTLAIVAASGALVIRMKRI